MTVSYFVRYDISALDENAFLQNYRARHVPILARWPGMRRVVLHTRVEAKDPVAVNGGRTVLLAQLEFDDQESLDRALASRERADAREDFKRFPPYEGSVTHQALASEVAWRRNA